MELPSGCVVPGSWSLCNFGCCFVMKYFVIMSLYVSVILISVAGPERWLWHIGYRRPYGDPCGGNALPSGDSNTQCAPYCSNQYPVRLLIAVLLYFLQVWCHEYVAAVMVLSRKYSSTYSLTLTCLSYAANLRGATIRCYTDAYGTKDTHYRNEWTQTTK